MQGGFFFCELQLNGGVCQLQGMEVLAAVCSTRRGKKKGERLSVDGEVS